MIREICTGLLGLTSTSLLASLASAEIRVHPLVYTQQPATGFPSGAVIAGLVTSPRPLLNEHGVVAFSATASGGGVSPQDDAGIWLADESGLRLLVREGDAVPGIEGRVFSMLWLAGLSANDEVWFLATMLGLPSNDRVLCSVRPGEPVDVVARSGDPVPGLPGENWSNLFLLGTFSNSWVNASGELIFGGDTNMGNRGLFLADEVGIVPLLVSGDPFPDVPGATLVSLVISPQWSDTGVATVIATIAGPDVTAANDRVVIACDTGGAHLVAREGDLIPDSESLHFGSAFPTDESRAPSDSAGFEAKITGAGVTSANDDALFFGPSGALAMIFRERQALPGGPPTLTLGPPIWTESNSLGAVFWATASDGRPGIYQATPTTIVRIAREGDPAPDAPANVTLANLDSFGNDGAVRTSVGGRLALHARTSHGRTFVMATDRIGNLRDACGSGDPIVLPGLPSRVIGNVSNAAINDAGQIAVPVLFTTSGSGILRIDVGCPGDGCDAADIAGQDCQVTIADLSLLLAHFGQTGGHPTGDIDRDDDVDLADLQLVLSAFGQNCAE